MHTLENVFKYLEFRSGFKSELIGAIKPTLDLEDSVIYVDIDQARVYMVSLERTGLTLHKLKFCDSGNFDIQPCEEYVVIHTAMAEPEEVLDAIKKDCLETIRLHKELARFIEVEE